MKRWEWTQWKVKGKKKERSIKDIRSEDRREKTLQL